MDSNELQHHGVKGMKWGVKKKYLNSNGGLNDKGIKKYAKKQYAKEQYNSNTSALGKAYDKFTSAHKHGADIQYGTSSKATNKKAAEKYLNDKNKAKRKSVTEKVARASSKVGTKSAKAAITIGRLYLTDQIFFRGAGTAAAKTAAKHAGRLAVSAIIKARGGTNIKWYD